MPDEEKPPEVEGDAPADEKPPDVEGDAPPDPEEPPVEEPEPPKIPISEDPLYRHVPTDLLTFFEEDDAMEGDDPFDPGFWGTPAAIGPAFVLYWIHILVGALIIMNAMPFRECGGGGGDAGGHDIAAAGIEVYFFCHVFEPENRRRRRTSTGTALLLAVGKEPKAILDDVLAIDQRPR